jgi:hypothetical protein
MAIDEVGSLLELSKNLDTRMRALHRESNSVVCFIPGEDGTPKQVVSDPDRFAEIGKEMEDNLAAKTATLNKLAALEELLARPAADGDLANLDGTDYLEQSKRLRFEHANKMHVMMCNYRAALTPTELEKVPEYQSLRDRCLPEIARLEANAAEDQALANKIRTILRGSNGNN